MSTFAEDVRWGLGRRVRKELPSKYLYDALGSTLFEAITLLPEYGLTRADERILCRHAKDIPGEFRVVAELGSGSGRKTRAVLAALQPGVYVPIDLSKPALEKCARDLSPMARVAAVEASYLDGLRAAGESRDRGALLVLFLGSSIGNFEQKARLEFLMEVSTRLVTGDGLLIGFDLVKDVPLMRDAYDDPTGVTAAFNLNLLGRINRELGGNFDLRTFAHEARWNAEERRIEMHLRSRGAQSVEIPGARLRCEFAEGETIWTESCQKFELGELRRMAELAGFAQQAVWVDEEWPFAECLWRVR